LIRHPVPRREAINRGVHDRVPITKDDHEFTQVRAETGKLSVEVTVVGSQLISDRCIDIDQTEVAAWETDFERLEPWSSRACIHCLCEYCHRMVHKNAKAGSLIAVVVSFLHIVAVQRA
jgi:hypothetical protein